MSTFGERLGALMAMRGLSPEALAGARRVCVKKVLRWLDLLEPELPDHDIDWLCLHFRARREWMKTGKGRILMSADANGQESTA